MIISSMELLYLAAYWILVYEYVVMRHKSICAESDAMIGLEVTMQIFSANYVEDIEEAEMAESLYWNRGTK